MKHSALNEEQILEAGLLSEGTKDFTIITAREYVSDKGNPTFELSLSVFDENGEARSIRDWVTPKFPKKFKHLHDALGMLDLYAKGDTKAEDLHDKSGKLILKIGEPRTNKDGFEVRYNEVVDYVKKDDGMVDMPKPVSAVIDDEVPF